jgi:hypothetical protein
MILRFLFLKAEVEAAEDYTTRHKKLSLASVNFSSRTRDGLVMPKPGCGNRASGGWYGTDEESNRVEMLLKLLDSESDRFAGKHGLRVTRNHTELPERSLGDRRSLSRLIQVFLVDQSSSISLR